jgi:sulfite exporter TauE/SafE
MSLWGVFIGGLLGSAHCLGMCGPLVATIESLRPGRWSLWSNLPLHGGRVLTYTLMGAVAGLAGGALERAGLAVGLQGVAAFLGGAAMIVFGLVMLGWIPFGWGMTVGDKASAKIASSLGSNRPLSGLLLGFYWGFLPCGLVWAFLLRAGAAGSMLGGASVMAVFGAGTVPALLVLGSLAGYVGARHRQVLQRVGAATVMVLGVLLVLRGAAGAGWIPHLKIAPKVPLF